MKHAVLPLLTLAACLWPARLSARQVEIREKTTVEAYAVTEHLRYNEGSVAIRNAVLLSNFGGTECDPLNRNGLGYIVSLTREGAQVLIPPDGNLNAPKGMAVKNDRLFIADVGCIVIYHLRRLGEPPLRIAFPEEDIYVNDIIILGNMLLASVTNTGSLYTLDVRDMDGLPEAVVQWVAHIPGANGLAEHEGTLYIASYNPSEIPDAYNGIYAADLTRPDEEPLNLMAGRPGQYDGLAVSSDGKKLYFTNWKDEEGKPEVGYINLEAEELDIVIFDLGIELQGPADICISDGYLYVPDLPASKVYMIELD